MDLSALRDTYRSALLKDILPFWLKHGIDHENGGFFNAVDRDGCQGFGGVVDLVNGPKEPPAVHPTVQQVFGEIIGQKERHCEQRNSQGFGCVGEHAG